MKYVLLYVYRLPSNHGDREWETLYRRFEIERLANSYVYCYKDRILKVKAEYLEFSSEDLASTTYCALIIMCLCHFGAHGLIAFMCFRFSFLAFMY